VHARGGSTKPCKTTLTSTSANAIPHQNSLWMQPTTQRTHETRSISGSGQGAGDSMARWFFFSDALIRAYNKTAISTPIVSPISKLQNKEKIQAFVDDSQSFWRLQATFILTDIFAPWLTRREVCAVMSALGMIVQN
jgi:hypothetical protein